MNAQTIIAIVTSAAGLLIGSILTTLFSTWFRGRNRRVERIEESLTIIFDATTAQNQALSALVLVNAVALNGQAEPIQKNLSTIDRKMREYAAQRIGRRLR